MNTRMSMAVEEAIHGMRARVSHRWQEMAIGMIDDLMTHEASEACADAKRRIGAAEVQEVQEAAKEMVKAGVAAMASLAEARECAGRRPSPKRKPRISKRGA